MRLACAMDFAFVSRISRSYTLLCGFCFGEIIDLDTVLTGDLRYVARRPGVSCLAVDLIASGKVMMMIVLHVLSR